MAHIHIFLTDNRPYGSGQFRATGQAVTSDMADTDGPVPWEYIGEMSALATTINAGIKQAAIDAVELADWGPIGSLDKKTLFAGGMGL